MASTTRAMQASAGPRIDHAARFADRLLRKRCRTRRDLHDQAGRSLRPLALVEAPLARHLFAFVWLPRDMVATQVPVNPDTARGRGIGAPARLEPRSRRRQSGDDPLRVRHPRWRHRPRRARSKSGCRRCCVAGAKRSRPSSARSRTGRALPRCDAFRRSLPDGFPWTLRPARSARYRALARSGREPGKRNCPRRAMYFCERESDDACVSSFTWSGRPACPRVFPRLKTSGSCGPKCPPCSTTVGWARSTTSCSISSRGAIKALVERAGAIEEALAAVLNGEAENDPFNRLVPEAGLAARRATGCARSIAICARRAWASPSIPWSMHWPRPSNAR